MHPRPQENAPPMTVEVPQPRNPSMLIIPETRKKVFAVCNSDGMLYINVFILRYEQNAIMFKQNHGKNICE
jgi:hypothetical protein